MGKKPLTLEQRERRRAYLKAWRAEHREHCIAYDKRQRQKRREQRRADNARGNKSLLGGSATTKKIERASTKSVKNVAGCKSERRNSPQLTPVQDRAFQLLDLGIKV